MSILGDLFSLGGNVAGLLGTNSKNKAAKDQYNKQSGIANQQLDIADLIKQAALAYQKQGSGYTDIYGGGVHYDPTTGTWKATLGGPQQAIQGASNAEQLARDSGDQAIRRAGLTQSDQLRQGYAADADAARRSYNLFNQGVGAVDPNQIASSLSLDRTRAVNAGFDQAQRAAGTMSLRTGASASDAYSNLARARASAIAGAMGNPEVEGLQTAEGINNSRRNNLFGAYTSLGDRGRDFADVGFNPSTLDQNATDNLFKTQALDLSKFDSTNSALGAAAGTIGSAGAGLRQANQQQQQNTDYFGLSKFLNSTGQLLSSSGDVTSLLSKLGIG